MEIDSLNFFIGLYGSSMHEASLGVHETHWFSSRQIFSFSVGDHPFSTYTQFSEKNMISYPLICTCTCAYKGVRNVNFIKKCN